MTLRSIATPLTIGSFIVVCLTGLFLFFGIRGFTGPVHEWSSLLFVVGSILHIIINWRATLAHLRKPLGATLAIVFLALSVLSLMPRGEKGKNPRQAMGQAMELILDADLQGTAALTRQSEQALVDKLGQAGFKTIDAKASLREIARANGRNPMELVGAILPVKAGAAHSH